MIPLDAALIALSFLVASAAGRARLQTGSAQDSAADTTAAQRECDRRLARALRHRARRHAGRRLHAHQRPRHRGAHPHVRRHRPVAEDARPDGQAGRRRARLRRPAGLREELALLRRDRRPLRQPHRARTLHARRQDLHARDQQRRRTACTAASRGSTRSCGTPSRSKSDSGVGVVLTHTSPDGDEGYPGTLHAKVTYTLNDRDELAIDYEATTDKATPVNLTNHTYWNLAGDGTRDILGHVLDDRRRARSSPVDSTLIPTGEIMPVAGTPFDFRTPTADRRTHRREPHIQLRYGSGYDHTFVLDRADQAGLVHAARVTEPTTGRTLDIYTTEPGVQFYSGNFLDGTAVGKSGHVYKLPLRPRARDASLPRFAEPAEVSLGDPAARRDVQRRRRCSSSARRR